MHRPLPDALAKLSQDHLEFRRVLNVLDRQTEAVAQYRAPDLDALSDAIQYMHSFPVLHHHEVEDRIYEDLKRRAPTIAPNVELVQSQHQEASERLERFAAAVRDIVAEQEISREAFCRAARDYMDFQRNHIRGEEAYFFDAALEHLTPDDWAEVDQAVRRSESEAEHKDLSARYERVRDRIMSY